MNPTRTSTRTTWWLISIVAAVTVASAPAVLAEPPAAAATTPAAAVSTTSPAGTWALQVHFDGQTYQSSVLFTPKGRAFLVGLSGAGTWTERSRERFSFTIAEPIFDGSGTYLGWVEIEQKAVLSGNTFVSEGVSRQYDAQDVLTRTVNATDYGTRS